VGLAGSEAEEIHLPGALAIPGIVDSHIHLTWGAHALTILNLEEVGGASVLLHRLREYAHSHPDRPWIEGYGLNYQVLDDADASPRQVLDGAIAERPVFLRSFDYHTAWCNGEALRRAGIERGRDLQPPNEVVRDPASGLTTGTLRERGAHSLVSSLIPEASSSELDDELARTMCYLNTLGVTSVHNMDGDEERLRRYERLRAEVRQTVRAAHYMTLPPDAPIERLAEIAELAASHTDEWNQIPGVKLYLDGVIENKTALLCEPYADGSGGTGFPAIDLDRYREIVAEADRLFLNVATHAIGDRAVRLALDAYRHAYEMNGERSAPQAGAGGAMRSPRWHRVEHAEMVQPADVRRLGRAVHPRVTASMQPLHAIPIGHAADNVWSRHVGPDREIDAFPWRRLRDVGARICFGSDWPIVTPDPRAGLLAAVTRCDAEGNPPGGWHPEQCLTLSEALIACTRHAAQAQPDVPEVGEIRTGYFADIAVFGEDLFGRSPDEWTEIPIVLTMVNGNVVHRTR